MNPFDEHCQASSIQRVMQVLGLRMSGTAGSSAGIVGNPPQPISRNNPGSMVRVRLTEATSGRIHV